LSARISSRIKAIENGSLSVFGREQVTSTEKARCGTGDGPFMTVDRLEKRRKCASEGVAGQARQCRREAATGGPLKRQAASDVNIMSVDACAKRA